MSRTSYRRLLKCIPNGITTPKDSVEPDAVSLFDALVETLSCGSLTLFCANDMEYSNHTCNNAVIYAGNCAPPLLSELSLDDDIPPLSDWQAFRTPIFTDLVHDEPPGIVRYMINSSGMFNGFPAVSTSIISKAFHGRMLHQSDVDVAHYAYGKSGPYQNRQGSVGFNAYPISVRNNDVATHVSPNCGPGHLSECTYHLQSGCDVRYMPAIHALTKIQNESIMLATKSFYRHLRCSSVLARGDKTNEQAFHSILTINFGNQTHYDKYDHAKSLIKPMISELEEVRDHPMLGNARKTEAKNLISMISEFENPLPTTCCYQHVKRNWKDDHTQIHAYFPFPSIGVVLKLHHMLSHVFLAGVISHCTCPPVFVDTSGSLVNVRIGYHPDHYLVACGGKKKDKDKSEEDKLDG